MKYAFKPGQQVAVICASNGTMHVTVPATYLMPLSGGRCKCADDSGKRFNIDRKYVYPNIETLEAATRTVVSVDARDPDNPTITEFPE